MARLAVIPSDGDNSYSIRPSVQDYLTPVWSMVLIRRDRLVEQFAASARPAAKSNQKNNKMGFNEMIFTHLLIVALDSCVEEGRPEDVYGSIAGQ